MKKNIIFILLIILEGCAVKPLPATKKYTIGQNIDIEKISTTSKCLNINIAFPQSSAEILSKNIIYVKGLEKNRYYFSRWFESPNLMISKLLYKVFKKVSICKNIYYMMPKESIPFNLESKILEFDQVFEGKSSKGVVDIIFYITDKNGNILSQKEFRVEKNSLSNNAKGGVEALSKATKEIIEKAVVWANGQISVK